MTIYPAIDLLGGKCVRLRQGRYDDCTVFSDDPVQTALQWQDAGAQYLHVVDLDGARGGSAQNFAAVSAIASALSIPVQIGGGIRSEETITTYLDAGISRVILGTKAVQDRTFLAQILRKYASKIVVGIDAKDGKVAVSGWEEVCGDGAVDFAKTAVNLGAQTIIYTDIATDGMLSGPNLPAMQEMAAAVDASVIASGGVGNIGDVRALLTTGVSGVIIGRALYDGKVDLAEAIAIAKGGDPAC